MSLYAPMQVGFIHIPKNGGMSISKWFEENVPNTKKYYKDHWSASKLYEAHPDISFMFSVVKNPWARMVSIYHYLMMHQNRLNHKLKINIVDCSFEDFINIGVGTELELWYNLSTPQIRWLDDKIDYIMRAENLDYDFKAIQKIFGCNKPLSRVNKTQHDHYSTYYNDRLINIIGELFIEDIEKFNYEFELG